MKPETRLIKRVHKLLPDVYHEKMHNIYRGGTADVWYSGSLGDLWVEYKYVPWLPKSPRIVYNLSALQQKWLDDRLAEGRNVAVMFGFETKILILTDAKWRLPLTSGEVRHLAVGLKEAAQWIRERVGASPCRSVAPSKKSLESLQLVIGS